MARPTPAQCIRNSLKHRFGETLAVDENLAGLDALARMAGRRVHRRYKDQPVDAGTAAAAVRLRAVGAEQERSAAGRHLDRQQGRPGDHRRSHSGPAVHPHRAGVPGVPGERTAAAGNREDARQAVPERSSRSVLQRRGRCRHRAGDLHRRRRRGRTRHLPDQRDPRSFGEGERDAEAAAAGDPGGRDVRRLAVGGGAYLARGSASSTAIHDGQIRRRRLSPTRIDAYDKRRAAIHPYKPRDPARWGDVPFYGWSEDKARQYGVPQRADFGAFVRGKGFKLD